MKAMYKQAGFCLQSLKTGPIMVRLKSLAFFTRSYWSHPDKTSLKKY